MIIGCDQCRNTRLNVVMLKNELWKAIRTSPKEVLCVACMESRLGRKITLADLRECGATDLYRLGAYFAKNTPPEGWPDDETLLNSNSVRVHEVRGPEKRTS